MNPNPAAIRILCFGDSNTWGQIPGPAKQRYTPEERFTGILQKSLGDGYEVIEEGLSSRTIAIDDPDPLKPGRNGLTFLHPLLQTHIPLDWIIVMLGTNDLKTQYKRTPEQITESMKELIHQIGVFFTQKSAAVLPKLLLIAPPVVLETRPELYGGAHEKSKKLGVLYKQLAQSIPGCLFLNAAEHIVSSPVDGVHFEQKDHQILSQVILEAITNKNFNS